MTPQEIAALVAAARQEGYDDGWQDGYQAAHDDADADELVEYAGPERRTVNVIDSL